MDNPRFGVKDWDEAKQAKKPEYDFGQMLSQAADIAKPVPCPAKRENRYQNSRQTPTKFVET